MGTRGVIGFYKNGKTKVTYNHFDSYPVGGVGEDVYKEVKATPIAQLNKAFAGIRLVKNDRARPPASALQRYARYGNPQVGGPMSNTQIQSWYQLLRNVQGTLMPYIRGDVGHMIDSQEFLTDSLYCEWGYIVNLDTNKFEVWKGFQTHPNNDRYAVKPRNAYDGTKYYSCKKVKTYPLGKMPPVSVFLADMRRIDK